MSSIPPASPAAERPPAVNRFFPEVYWVICNGPNDGCQRIAILARLSFKCSCTGKRNPVGRNGRPTEKEENMRSQHVLIGPLALGVAAVGALLSEPPQDKPSLGSNNELQRPDFGLQTWNWLSGVLGVGLAVAEEGV